MSRRQSGPSATKVKPRLTQKMMSDYQLLCANFEVIEQRLSDERERMIHLLKDPELEQEDGPLIAILKEIEVRRPKWKEEYIKVAGKGAAEEVSKTTPPTIQHKIEIDRRPTIEI